MSVQQLWIWPFTHYKSTSQVMVSRVAYKVRGWLHIYQLCSSLWLMANSNDNCVRFHSFGLAIPFSSASVIN